MPIYIWLFTLLAAVGIPAVTCVALYRGARTIGKSRRSAARTATVAGAGWAGWTAVIWALAAAGLFHLPPSQQQPWIPLVFVVGTALAFTASKLPGVQAILAAPGALRLLAWPQVLRVAGVVFLAAMIIGKLPAAFALPAGLGDIAVGLAAPFAIRSGRVLWLNITGLLDLVVAMTLGFLTGVGQRVVLDVTPSAEQAGTLPLVLVPLAAVPLAVALHLVSFVALARESRRRAVVPA
ncbi:hypothetical protein QRX60_27595 [Amycolatopsis mongoliensis]|uniref:Uncharacterized protein n=1 Tax=Amycolatopsis mongoliensis TaxID=715475 RepID=A0A9Y2JIE0_9PSEU|nr:hypothetical protein [Amycolatopsis sp. 4-36]WIX97848.1 hypothetical protein QRX60_27595 [Amycolatopsis sp. 4-36]